MSKKELDENYPSKVETEIDIKLSNKQFPLRIDVYLTRQIQFATRAKVQQAIDEGRVTINGKPVKASYKIKANDNIKYIVLKSPPIRLIPEDLDLKIIYEDEHLLVVNKAPFMCVHPSFGHRKGTLVNGLMYHFGQREAIELEIDDDEEEDTLNEGEIFASSEIRPGIVHRLDKDTSGLLVVAKNSYIHSQLSKQFSDRTTGREYNAIVWGNVKNDRGTIEGNIGRSSYNRQIFQIVNKGGRYAKTDYQVLERFPFATLLKLKLHTGRTHQIRVHCSHIKHTLVGDVQYGGDKLLAGTGTAEIKKIAARVLSLSQRQMLHAKTLEFDHPITEKRMSFTSELPDDMEQVLDVLREFSKIYYDI